MGYSRHLISSDTAHVLTVEPFRVALRAVVRQLRVLIQLHRDEIVPLGMCQLRLGIAYQKVWLTES